MAENENVVEPLAEVPTEEPVKQEPVQPVDNKPSKGEKIKAGIKEWFRKRIVTLKHKTQNIPFCFLLLTSFLYLCFLGTLSKFIYNNSGISSLGIFELVNTLASILILLVFLNAFPKRKKVNIIMLVLVFVVLALMIVMDVLFYVNVINYGNRSQLGAEEFFKGEGVMETLNSVIVHIVFLALTVVVLALLPLYKKLICKINTSKDLASNNINEEIDTSEENG